MLKGGARKPERIRGHSMARRVWGAGLAVVVTCVCGCGADNAGRATGTDYEARFVCDELLAKLIAHAIAICERESGPSGTDKGREWAFRYVKRDLEGIQGLVDATHAARAMRHPFAGSDAVLENSLSSGIRECERQIRSDGSPEDRRVALNGVRSTIVAARDLMKAYYTAAGLQWPDVSDTGTGQAGPSRASAGRHLGLWPHP